MGIVVYVGDRSVLVILFGDKGEFFLSKTVELTGFLAASPFNPLSGAVAADMDMSMVTAVGRKTCWPGCCWTCLYWTNTCSSLGPGRWRRLRCSCHVSPLRTTPRYVFVPSFFLAAAAAVPSRGVLEQDAHDRFRCLKCSRSRHGLIAFVSVERASNYLSSFTCPSPAQEEVWVTPFAVVEKTNREVLRLYGKGVCR